MHDQTVNPDRQQVNPYPREPHATLSVALVVALILLTVALAPVILLTLVPLGDCFESACAEPRSVTAAAYIVAVAIVIVALPVIGSRALFGDHPVGRILLTLSGLALGLVDVAADANNGLMWIPAGFVLAASAFAWWKWWASKPTTGRQV
jgi:hypothetical protein